MACLPSRPPEPFTPYPLPLIARPYPIETRTCPAERTTRVYDMSCVIIKNKSPARCFSKSYMPKQFYGGPRRRLDLQIPDALLQLFCTSPVSVRMLQTSNKQTQAIRASRTQSIQYRHHPDEPAHQPANNLHSRRSSKSPQSLSHTPDSPRLDPVDGQPVRSLHIVHFHHTLATR